MLSPSTLASWEGLILIGGLIGIVVWKMMTGEISLEQLFEGETLARDGTRSSYASGGRVQAFLVTIYVAFYYLMQVIHNPTGFPDVPTVLVGVLAGSHALYLGDKAQAMLLGRFRNS